MLIERVADGHRNLTIRLSGLLTVNEQFEVKTECKLLKLTALAWLIEEKHGMYLGWTYDTILLPMESRNSFRLDIAIPSPPGWDGSLWFTPTKVGRDELPRAYFIIADFDK